MSWYLGIDPGVTGAVAVLDGGGILANIFDMPTSEKMSGKGVEINPAVLTGFLRGYVGDEAYVALERVSAMPPIKGKQRTAGTTSSFNFGRSFGVIEGVVAALGFPVVYFTPNVWKRAAGLTGKDKDAARTLAIQRHPEAADWLTRKKDHGRAEAILIADHLFNEMKAEVFK